jgi:hypothetical protein
MPLGYEECDLHVYLDYPQERQNKQGPFIFATDGTQIDSASLTDCIIDPCTLSVFGKPLPMTDEWRTQYTGGYARFQFADYTFISASKWKFNNLQNAGDTYIYSISDNVNDQAEKISLTADRARNQPIFFSFSKNQKKSSSKQPIVKLFWENALNKDKDVQLHFQQDGSCDVYRGYVLLPGTIIAQTTGSTVTGIGTRFTDATFGLLPGNKLYDVFGILLGTVNTVISDISLTLTTNASHNYVGEYSTLTPNKVQTYSRTESNYSSGRPITTVANPNDQFNDVSVIPCRGRDLLVITSFGLNFCHTFADLGSGDIFPDPPRDIDNYAAVNYTRIPIILPSGKFSVQIPSGKLSFQTANLNFKSNWTFDSQLITMPSAPPIKDTTATGTITFSNWTNTTTVTGSGTSFLSEVPVNSVIYARVQQTSGSIYVGWVESVASDTSLTIFDPVIYQGSGADFYVYPRVSGTISFSSGDNIINGVGTSFLSDLSLLDKIYLADGTYVGQVDAIISNSQFTIAYPTTSGAGSAPFFKNFNEYSVNNFENFQVEPFGYLDSINLPTNTSIGGAIITGNGSDDSVFNGTNNKFRIRIKQTNEFDTYQELGYMFYAGDLVFPLLNQTTSNATIDIITAIQGLNISRSETGELTLSFDARKVLLSDLGVVKPDILSNRPIKVTLAPRRLLSTGTISKGASDQLIGTGTLFTEEYTENQKIYTIDGLFVGYVYSIESDTALTLFGFTTEEFVNVEFSPYPIFNEFVIFEGYLDSPDINYLQSGPIDNTYSEYALLSFTAIDKKQRLNAAYFSSAPNFDSVNISNIIGTTIAFSGEGNNEINNFNLIVSASLDSYQVPLNRNNSNGQYNFAINLGDSAGGFIEKIRSDFAQNFVFYARGDWGAKRVSQNGFNNYTTFFFKDYNAVPKLGPDLYNVKLYLNEIQAQSFDLIPTYAAYKRTVRSLRKTYETPEANRIVIVGLDKSDGSRIEYVLNDEASQNSSTAPATRPDNWLGDIYPFVMINDKLNSKTDVAQCGNQFYDKLTPGREIVEFESDLLTYFDNDSHYVPQGPTPLSGEIQFFDNSDVVVGTLTEFTTELEIGDVLYDNTGKVIGQIYSITDDFELYLSANASFTAGTSIPFNNYTIYLNEFNYIDIADIVVLYDENNVGTFYQILDWNVDFVRENNTDGYSAPNVRFAKYRAKKVVPPANEEIVTNPTYVEPALNQKIITKDESLEGRVYIVNFDNTKTYTATLSGHPTGMTASIVDNYASVEWIPNTGQQNKIYNGITVTISDGTVSKPYVFSVRVYNVS